MTFPVYSASGAVPPYTITKSLRFRSAATAYLSKAYTFGLSPADTSPYIKTYSMWIKLGVEGVIEGLISNRFDGNNAWYIYLTATGNINLYSIQSGSLVCNLVTTASYVDPSSWYHVVISIDTTQATSTDRIKLYVNGVQVTSFSTATYPAQNTDACSQLTPSSGAWTATIGALSGIGNYYDGYMAEMNVVDGQALPATSFGSFSSTTGVWQPVKYSGTYGVNGFYLKFTDASSTTALGTDYSGNSNTWAVTNISLSADWTYDSMLDVPTLTNATTSNYSVMNFLSTTPTTQFVNGNLGTANLVPYAYYTAMNTIGVSSGKWYAEVNVTAVATGSYFGISTTPVGYSNYLAFDATGYAYANNGLKGNSGAYVAYGATFTTGDTIGIALDLTAGTLTFYKNGVSQGVAYSGLSGTFFFATSGYHNGVLQQYCNINFGQQPWAYAPPAGFNSVNTYNLPTPSIANGTKYFTPSLYTGTNATQTVNNTGFYPDFTWIKDRTSANSNFLVDSVRGVSAVISSNLTNPEATATGGTGITALSSTGFTLGTETSTYGSSNANGDTYVSWQWNAGSGSSGSNTNGSITSTVSVNASAGFSIVQYTGTGANATVGHGLGVAPQFIIVKDRAGTHNWFIYNSIVGNTQYLNFTTGTPTTDATVWNNTSPTSSVFSVGTATAINNAGDSFIAYCWTPIAGYSSFGSYFGNGSTVGPFIYTGFKPAFVMIKNISNPESSYPWVILDVSRNPYNTAQNVLAAGSAAAEGVGGLTSLNILSNGFNLTSLSDNASGNNFIYMAFAQNPFKYALAQ